MIPMLRLLALAALCVTATAQITEIPAMTVGSSVIDMDAASLGSTTTTLTALRNAGTNGGAPLAAVRLTANTAASGIYNTNPELGRALGRRATDGALLLVPVYGSFDAFDAEFDLDFASTEFGISIGDWLGSMVLDFFYQGTPVGSILSTPYTTANAKFFQSAFVFDRVRVQADTSTANWVIPQLHFQSQGPWRLYGTGCAGSGGVPTMSLVTVPRLGATYQYTVSNLPTTEVFFVNVYGLSSTTDPNLGTLPASLATYGAPGCSALCNFAITQYEPNFAGVSIVSLALPNVPALLNQVLFHQAYPYDPTANALNFTASPGVRVVVLGALAP